MQNSRTRLRTGSTARSIALAALLATAIFILHSRGSIQLSIGISRSPTVTTENGSGSGGGPMTSPGPGLGPAWAELHAQFVAEVAASELQEAPSATDQVGKAKVRWLGHWQLAHRSNPAHNESSQMQYNTSPTGSTAVSVTSMCQGAPPVASSDHDFG